jgi:hypothetical protein
MTRRYGALVLAVVAAGCTTEPASQTGTVEQHAGGRFPNATLPPQPIWKQAPPPLPGVTQGYVLWFDAQGGYWNALLADPGQGKITYAVKVLDGDLGLFLKVAGIHGRIDVIRIPPAPPPSGTDWMARFGLEIELDVATIASRAYELSK